MSKKARSYEVTTAWNSPIQMDNSPESGNSNIGPPPPYSQSGHGSHSNGQNGLGSGGRSNFVSYRGKLIQTGPILKTRPKHGYGMMRLVEKLNRTKKIDASVMETPLNRCLSTFDICLLGIGHMIGAGIYVLTGEVAKNKAGPAVILSFILAGITSILAALCYAEFGARVPKAGSAYVYTYVSVGEFWAFLIGWNIVLEHMIGAASVARVWSGSFDSLLNKSIETYTREHVGEIGIDFFGQYPDFLAAVLCIGLSVLMALGVKGSAYFNTAFTAVNLSVVSFVICYGLYYADFGNWTNYGGFMPFGWSGVVAGAASCFYAYVGFDSIATAGEEARNPATAVPRATFIAMTVASVAYIGMSCSLTLMVPYTKIDPASALPSAFQTIGATWAKYLVAVGSLAGMTTSLFGSLFALPRCLYAMASDGILFNFFATVNKRTQMPVINLFICSICTAAIAVVFDVEKLVEFMSIGTLMAYTIVSASVIILRYQPTWKVGLTSSASTPGPEYSKQIELSGTLKRTFSFLDPVLEGEPGKVVTGSVLIMTLCILGFFAILQDDFADVKRAKWWAILLLALFGGGSVLCFIIICIYEENQTALSFKVPLVPVLPTVSIICNVFLMTNLSWMTWVRFIVWIAIGLLIYFGYGIRHSKEKGAPSAYSSLIGSQEAGKEGWGSLHNPEQYMAYEKQSPLSLTTSPMDDKKPIVHESEH